ncbi:YSIRK-type signal peptide-containing protein [Limosilactobacillus caecicola]|uniref:YSIRK-type signal peptide-containing protein n=1 Tax=Limosilactobacillus caecicola TaxID=2941332 RepID=UPI00203D8865|nr:YSIRK-type signal peptide-containing protein [Limosilactobacillus caecicola]
MLSSNNHSEMQKKQDAKKQRFTIKKLTVGVASVLVGLAIYGSQTQVASADTTDTTAATTAVEPATTNQDNQTATTTVNDSQLVSQATSQAEHDKLNQNLPSIVTKNSADSGSSLKTNGDQHQIVNLPDGAQYNLSISATNDTTGGSESGQTSSIYLPDDDGHNYGLLNYQTASNVQINYELVNPTDTDMTIGGTQVSISNPLGKTQQGTDNTWLRITNGGKVVDQDGNTIDSLTIQYDIDNQWYTAEEAETAGLSLSNADKIQVSGTLPANTTAYVIVPLTFDRDQVAAELVDGEPLENVISLWNTNYSGQIHLRLSSPLWQLSDVTNDTLMPMLRTADGYQELPADVTSELLKALPRAGQVLLSQYIQNYLNVQDSTSSSDPILWQGGRYYISTAAIQQVLGKYGYVVNINQSNTDIVPYYSYIAKGGKTSLNADGSVNSNPQYSFYIEVHPVLLTKDTEYEAGDPALNNWSETENITTLNDLEYDSSDGSGNYYTTTAVDPSNAKLVSITDEDGNTISTINADTPAGVYTLTYEYALDGSDNPNMLISNTATVTLRAKETTPTTPEEPTDPTTPEEPTTPGEPTDPTTPENSTTPSTVDDSTSSDQNASVTDQVTNSVADQSVTLTTSTASTNDRKSTEHVLPQTGNNHQSAFIYVGFASLLMMLGLAGSRKKKED